MVLWVDIFYVDFSKSRRLASENLSNYRNRRSQLKTGARQLMFSFPNDTYRFSHIHRTFDRKLEKQKGLNIAARLAQYSYIMGPLSDNWSNTLV